VDPRIAKILEFLARDNGAVLIDSQSGHCVCCDVHGLAPHEPDCVISLAIELLAEERVRHLECVMFDEGARVLIAKGRVSGVVVRNETDASGLRWYWVKLDSSGVRGPYTFGELEGVPSGQGTSS